MIPFIEKSVYVTRTMLAKSQIDFRSRYFAESQSDFSDNLAVDWTDLYNYLTTNAIGQSGITADNLVIRFVHRYSNKIWYMTGCCGIMSNPVVNPDGSTSYTVTDKNIFFKVADTEAISADTDPTHYAADYFNNFYFQPDSGPMVNLATDDPDHNKYVGNVMYPWKMEIVKLCFDNGYCDENGAPNYTTDKISLKFSSVCFTPDYPHATIMNINANGIDLVEDGTGTNSFKDMAADFGSMCPPNCSTYTQPADLLFQK